MSDYPYRPTRLFTIEQANAMLPLVRAITTDLAQLAGEIVERKQRVAELLGGRRTGGGDVYRDELLAIEAEIEKETDRLREYIRELRELGVEPKGAVEGLVDFPTQIDGRVAFLCWKLGEPEVLHWHDIDAGFAGRQPLTAGAASDERPDLNSAS